MTIKTEKGHKQKLQIFPFAIIVIIQTTNTKIVKIEVAFYKYNDSSKQYENHMIVCSKREKSGHKSLHVWDGVIFKKIILMNLWVGGYNSFANNKALLVDCGATAHVIIDESKIYQFSPKLFFRKQIEVE